MSSQYENNVQQPIFNIKVSRGGVLYGGAGVVRSSNHHPTEQHTHKVSTRRAHGGAKASVVGQTPTKPASRTHPRRQDYRQPSSLRGDTVGDGARPEWQARAQETGFKTVHVRGNDEFTALAGYISRTPYVSTQIKTLIFEGEDATQRTILGVDTFIGIVRLLQNVKSISLKQLSLYRHTDEDLISPLPYQVELCMSSVQPIDGQAVLDVLLFLPQLVKLELVDVGEPKDMISYIHSGQNIWEFAFLQEWKHLPLLPALKQLELHSGSRSGVCTSRFYLNLIRLTSLYSISNVTSLTILVVSCSTKGDVVALNGLLQCSPSLKHLQVDFSKYFVLDQPKEDECKLLWFHSIKQPLTRAIVVHVRHCKSLHTVTSHTFLSLDEHTKNELMWRCMCTFFDNIPANEITNVDMYIVVGEARTDQPERELKHTLKELDWPKLESAFLRLYGLSLRTDTGVQDMDSGNNVDTTMWFDLPFDAPDKFPQFIWDRFQSRFPHEHLYMHTLPGNMDG